MSEVATPVGVFAEVVAQLHGREQVLAAAAAGRQRGTELGAVRV